MKLCIAFAALFFVLSCSTKNGAPPGDGFFRVKHLYWEDYGDGEQTIVLVHGWSNTLHVWDEQIRQLSSSYRVIAVDLPGFGKSLNPDGAWTMASFGRDVADVIQFLDLSQVILVGFSMGGPVSIETAGCIPDKVMGIVLVDVLQNPYARHSDAFIGSFTSRYMDKVANPTVDKVKPFFKTHQDELAKRYLAMVADAPKTGWKESLENGMHWLNDDAREAIQGLQAPVFSINSDQYPTEAALFRKLSPLFKVRVVQGVGHVVFWESPGIFLEYLQEFIHDFQVLNQTP